MAQTNLFSPQTAWGASLSGLVDSLYGPDAAVKREASQALIEQKRADAELKRSQIAQHQAKRDAETAVKAEKATAISNLVAGMFGGAPQGAAVQSFRSAGGVQPNNLPTVDDDGGPVPQPPTIPMDRPAGYTPQAEEQLNRVLTGIFGSQALGDKNFEHSMKGAGQIQNQSMLSDVVSGLRTPERVGAGYAAVGGKPLYSDHQGRVLGNFSGALNEGGAQATANVGETNAKAGMERAHGTSFDAQGRLADARRGAILPSQSVTNEAGVTFPLAGSDISHNISASLFGPKTNAQPKSPLGYRQTADGNLEPIPGGPADLKIQGAFNKDTASLQSATASMDRLEASANELLQHPGLKSIAGIRGAIPNIPGTDAANAEALLTSLKAKVGFNTLQEMRNASATGGALGSVSDREHVLLQSNLAALDKAQNMPQLQQELAKIRQYAQEAKGRLNQAYNMRHAARASAPPQLPGLPAAPAAAAPEPTATDAQGNQVVFRNGQWQPL